MSDEPHQSGALLLAALERYERPLLAYATGMVGDRSKAEDLAQETFIRLAREESLPAEKVAPWLFTVCRRLAIDQLRMERRQVDLREAASLEDGRHTWCAPAASAALEEAEFREQLRRRVQELPESQREAVSLRFFSELSYAEIAEVMEQSQGTVGWLLHTAMQTLRARMRGSFELI